MKSAPVLLGITLLLIAADASAADWQWIKVIKVIDNAAYGWQTELGVAAVIMKGTSFKATLYWVPGAGQERIMLSTLSGTIRGGAITATENGLGNGRRAHKDEGHLQEGNLGKAPSGVPWAKR